MTGAPAQPRVAAGHLYRINKNGQHETPDASKSCERIKPVPGVRVVAVPEFAGIAVGDDGRPHGGALPPPLIAVKVKRPGASRR
jgi:hypothetical protein